MIRIKQTDSVIEPTLAGKKIYKNNLVNNAMYKDREINIIKKYGSVENYNKIKKQETKDWLLKMGWE